MNCRAWGTYVLLAAAFCSYGLDVHAQTREAESAEPDFIVDRVDIEGNDALDRSTLEDSFQIFSGARIRASAIEPRRQQVRQRYEVAGYPDADIRTIVFDTDDPLHKVVRLVIREGAPIRVGAVRLRCPGLPVPLQKQAFDIGSGDVADRATITAALQHGEAFIREHGWFEVAVEPVVTEAVGHRLDVIATCTLGPRYTITVPDPWPLSPSEVGEALELTKERLRPALGFLEHENHVRNLYEQFGYANARVHIERVELNPKRARLIVNIETGKQTRVVTIAFPGADHFEQSFLRDQVFSYLEEDLPGTSILQPVDPLVADDLGLGGIQSTRQTRRRPSRIDPQEVFYATTYHAALEHIRELYQADGYLSVRVAEPVLIAAGRNRVVASISIIEGPRTALARVTVAGNVDMTTREILELAQLALFEPFSYLALEQARLRIVEAYQERGFAFVKVEPVETFSADRSRAAVTLHVEEGPVVHVRRILIRGADRTDEDLVRDRLTFAPGDIYRPSKVSTSQDRLLALGVFNSVRIALVEPTARADEKDVLVTLVERKNQSMGLSGGFSTGQGIHAAFDYAHRNLFGYALGLNLHAQLGYQLFFVDKQVQRRFENLGFGQQLERRITVGLALPYAPFWGDLRNSLDFTYSHDNERDFGLEQQLLAWTGSVRATRAFSVSLTGELEKNDVKLFDGKTLDQYLETVDDARLQRLLRVPDGRSTLVAVRNSLTLDLRNNPFVPTSGLFGTIATEWAHTLSVQHGFFSHFVKLSASVSGYLPLGGGFVWANQLRAGRIFHIEPDSNTYPNRRFFLGGVDTMRGYTQDNLVPQDLADQIRRTPEINPQFVFRGGDAFILLRSELRFPIAGIVGGAIFADVGNLWADADLVEPWRLRPTAGAGVRLQTPIGQIAIDYGFVIVRRAALKESAGALHFAIGLF